MSVRTQMITWAAASTLCMSVTAAEANDRRQPPPREDYGYEYVYEPVSSGFYVTGIVGIGFGAELEVDDIFDVNLDGAFLFGGAVGYDNLLLGPNGGFRVELEVSHRSHGVGGLPDNSDDVDVTTLIFNGWYDFNVTGPLIPYAGLGVGIGFLRAFNDINDAGLALNIGGGANYHFNQRWLVGLNYRFLWADFENKNLPGKPGSDYSGSQFFASIGYKF